MPFAIPDWILELHRDLEQRGALDPLGTARLIDEGARLRGVAAVRDGLTVSLSRPFQVAEHAPEHSPAIYELQARIRHEDRVVLARDRLIVDNHGYPNTHLDSLNHVGLDGTWHDGSAADVDLPTSYIAGWAQHGLITRGVFLDVASIRETGWIQPGNPVTREDLAAAEARAGVTLEPGDAALLCMGRDEFEASGTSYEALTARPQALPGVGEDGLRWLAERGCSMLLWDFLEASEARLVGHLLIWGIGLLLIDNCDFRSCRKAMQGREKLAGLLCVAPLWIPSATGCLVNPQMLL